ncbi:MAG: beta-propeller domain-containing protein [Myxococcota bacterium]|nr:beta-propeller domain-containing protein [Myxococcota bacterium]
MQPRSSTHSLQIFGSCEELTAFTRQAAHEQLRATLEAQKQEALACLSGEGGGMVETDISSDSEDNSWDTGGGDEDWGEGEGEGEGEYDTDYTEPTEQEDGVHEADIVKTDGRHIFFVRGQELLIVTVDSSGKLALVSSTQLDEPVQELFLHGDRVMVFSSPYYYEVPESLRQSEEGDFSPSFTRVRVFDVTDASAPNAVFDTIYSGAYVSARMVDSAVRIILRGSFRLYEDFRGIDPWAFCGLPKEMGIAAVEAAFDAALEQAAGLYENFDAKEKIPASLDMLSTGASPEPMVDCGQIYGPGTPEGTGLLTIVTLDAAQPETKARNTAVLADPGLVYATSEALYVTSSRAYAAAAFSLGLWSEEVSGLHKFDIGSDPSGVSYLGSGVVPGRMLNQFCLGEHQGFLRVASTTGQMWENTSDNHVTVLQEKDGVLETVGQLSGFGQGEEIYGARFMGERGFVVTFRQTDPLFTLDMSNPYEPRIAGEWQGPGYSSYMQPVGAGSLFALGQDDGAVVSLYNVANLAEPELVERLSLAPHLNPWSVDSVAVSTHKGVTFKSDTGLLAVPYSGYSESDYSYKEETGISLLSISETNIEPAGHVIVDDNDWTENENDGYAIALRALLVGDFVIGMSACHMVSANVSSLAKADELPLFEGSYCDDSYIDDGIDTDGPDGWETATEGTDGTGGWDTGSEATDEGEATDSE